MVTILQLNREELRDEIKTLFKESLDEIKSIPKPPPLPDKMFVQEAADLLRRKPSWIYNQTMKGTIPFQKFGKQLLFSRKELIVWMESNTKRKVSPEEKASKVLSKVASTKQTTLRT